MDKIRSAFIIILLASGSIMSPVSADDKKARYVGAGRYTCDSDRAGCAVVKQGNDSAERSRRYEREARERRVDAWVERSRERQERLKDSTNKGR